MSMTSGTDRLKLPQDSVAFKALAKIQSNASQLSGMIHIGHDLPGWIDRHLAMSALYTEAVLDYMRKGGMSHSPGLHPTRRVVIVRKFKPSTPNLSELLP